MTIRCIRKELIFLTIFHGLRNQNLSLNQEILPHLNIPDPCLLAIYYIVTFGIAVSVENFFENQIAGKQVCSLFSKYSYNCIDTSFSKILATAERTEIGL